MHDKLVPVRFLLRAQTTLALATICEDGIPRNTSLFYICDDHLNLYWFSSRSSRHSRNCLLYPEVSIAISNDAHSWQDIKGLQMQGRVSAISDRTKRKAITSEYVQRFSLGNLFSIAIRRSSLFCFKPRWVRYIDNSRRFGYRIEFDLPPPTTSSISM